MTAPPPAPPPALPDAIRYVLLGTAALITYDGETGTAGLLQGRRRSRLRHAWPARQPGPRRIPPRRPVPRAGQRLPAPRHRPTRSSTAPWTSCPATRPSARPGS